MAFFCIVKDMIPYAALRFASGVLRIIPFAGVTLLSDVLAFVLCFIVRYRRTTALQNLGRCFPQSTRRELHRLLPAVYKNITDVLLETIKAYSAGQSGVLPQVTGPDEQALASYTRHFRGAIIVTAHVSNWEWCGFLLPCYLPGRGIAVYRPLKNKRVDRHMRRHRENSGMQIIPMRGIVRLLSEGAASSHFVLLIADQSPDPDNAHWIDFFGNQTAFFKGPAVLAQRYNLPIFMAHLKRTRRHTYTMHLEPLCTDPQSITPEAITMRYAETLETLIRRSPAHWLWTHRRWKHKPPAQIHD